MITNGMLKANPVIPIDHSSISASDVALEINKSYYSAIQATNALDYVQNMRSDGFVVADTDVTTTKVQPGPFSMVPGRVRDGDKVGIDVNYQESTTTMSANWAGFHTCANGNGKEKQVLKLPTPLQIVINCLRRVIYSY